MVEPNTTLTGIIHPHRTAPVDLTTSRETLAWTLQAAREELIDEIRLAHGGAGTLANYTDRVDELLRKIYDSAREHTSTPLALLALGGYGRKQLCLHSDIDLLVIVNGTIGAAEERSVKAILHPLWDLRLDVGHQVRELKDFNLVELNNPKYLVALLDARFIAGDEGIFEQFQTKCLLPNTVWSQPSLEALLKLVEQRHAQYNRTLYQLEPDVKEAPGALRDVWAIRVITGLSGEANQAPLPLGRLDEAEDFLLRIRSILHLERGRNLNILTHELQEKAATLFGYPDGRTQEQQEQVEALMSTYFHHAHIINRSLALVIQSLRSAPDVPVVAVGNEMERGSDGIRFVDGTRASLQPLMWLRTFETALDQGCGVSGQVLTCIERHGERYSPERFFPSTDERDRLLRVLRLRPGLYDRLSEMHDSGLLGRMFPEFQKIYCRVIRDFYHKYTVDEHTLLSIRNLQSLCDPATRSRRRFAELLAELPSPELIVLALMFHDVGKWTNKNHAEESVRMALGALRRIKLAERDVKTVEFLIRHHLKMSVAAFRRDMEDPEVVKQFAKLVGTEQRLKMLCLLTMADLEAVGPDVLTPWKEELLWRLYVDTYNRLTLGYGDEVIDTTASGLVEITTARPDDITQDDLERFLEGLPQRYLRLVDQARVYEHVRLSRNLQRFEAHCSLQQKDSSWELTIVSLDQPQLFSKICGVLSYFGMDILRGQAMTNRHDVALDLFQFTDRENAFSLNPSGQSELAQLLDDVVAGREDIDRKLHSKALGLARRRSVRVAPMVHFDNQYSDRFSILEIVTQDAWGLLFHVSRVISRHECDIELVLISTEGDRAIDVFHLTKNGAKISTNDLMALQQALEKLLNETDETHWNDSN
jgi:[protein-PII] uridylyltransferase